MAKPPRIGPSQAPVARRRGRPTVRPRLTELSANGLTWINLSVLDAALRRARRALRVASAGHRRRALEAPASEDRRVPRLPVRRPPLPGLRQGRPAANAAELDVFLGHGYLVTLPNVELLPVTRLFQRCDDDDALRDDLFSKGSGYLLYHVLDDLFDYCFPILDKIGHKLDTVEDEMFEGLAEEVVRDLSNVKQEIISYRKIIKPERTTLRALERRTVRFLPEELESISTTSSTRPSVSGTCSTTTRRSSRGSSRRTSP